MAEIKTSPVLTDTVARKTAREKPGFDKKLASVMAALEM
jgi:hypothetical protein